MNMLRSALVLPAALVCLASCSDTGKPAAQPPPAATGVAPVLRPAKAPAAPQKRIRKSPPKVPAPVRETILESLISTETVVS